MTQLQEVRIWADEFGLSDAYVLALFSQAQLETGNFASNMFLNANNAFGMKIANVRPQERVGSYDAPEGKFALYADVETSFKDRVALDIYNKTAFPESYEELSLYMSEVLRKGYAQDLNYFDKWKAWINRNLESYDIKVEPGHSGNNGGVSRVKMWLGGTGGLLAVLAVLWYFRKRIPFISRFF